MKTKKINKQRNLYTLAAIRAKGGAHLKSPKADRAAAKKQIRHDLD